MIKSVGANPYPASQVLQNKNIKSQSTQNINSDQKSEKLAQIAKMIEDKSYKIDIDKIANSVLKELI